MIHRDLAPILKEAARQLPVIALLGPRQSGKTTLAQAVFKNHKYVSLEDLDTRAHAMNDPREFLEFHNNEHGIILDEIQNTPQLLSYVQTWVDREKVTGYFIVTGSQNFLVNEAITQTLAGRIAVFTLLPLSIHELAHAKKLPTSPEELIFKGSYPRLYDKRVWPRIFYPGYMLTYLERDVRQVTTITDLTVFKLFLQLCAGRTGQLLNVLNLANECGIPQRTAQGWLSLLEASYIIFLLQPYHKNFNKRLVKTPKLYFYDTGLASSLLGIESTEQVQTHYLRGSLLENLILADFAKQFYNSARLPALYFWRDNHKNEIDCIIEKGKEVFACEIKAGRTINSDYFKGLEYWHKFTHFSSDHSFVIFCGDQERNQKRQQGMVVSWKKAGTIITKLYE